MSDLYLAAACLLFGLMAGGFIVAFGAVRVRQNLEAENSNLRSQLDRLRMQMHNLTINQAEKDDTEKQKTDS